MKVGIEEKCHVTSKTQANITNVLSVAHKLQEINTFAEQKRLKLIRLLLTYKQQKWERERTENKETLILITLRNLDFAQ